MNHQKFERILLCRVVLEIMFSECHCLCVLVCVWDVLVFKLCVSSFSSILFFVFFFVFSRYVSVIISSFFHGLNVRVFFVFFLFFCHFHFSHFHFLCFFISVILYDLNVHVFLWFFLMHFHFSSFSLLSFSCFVILYVMFLFFFGVICFHDFCLFFFFVIFCVFFL